MPSSSLTFTEQASCATCSTEFTSTVMVVLGQECRWNRNCHRCVAEREADIKRMENAERRLVSEAREQKWANLCDEEYRTIEEGGVTDLVRLAKDCAKLPAIVSHQGRRGLLLRGSTGKCKTRATWRLLRRLFDEGKSIVAMAAGDFRRQYAKAAGTDFNEADWFDRLTAADVFFLDDLGKAQWTPGVWGCFFELVEARVKKGRPVIITTNDTGASLAKKCNNAETWEPLDRRLRENCQLITL